VLSALLTAALVVVVATGIGGLVFHAWKEHERLIAAALDVARARNDVTVFRGRFGTRRAPHLAWRGRAWIGMWFGPPSGREIPHGPVLQVQVATFLPIVWVQGMAGAVPETFTLNAGWRVFTGDAGFDTAFDVQSVLPSFARAVLDPTGLELLLRLRAVAPRAAVGMGGRAICIYSQVPLDAGAFFAAAEAWIEHVLRVGGVHAPSGLCHQCGWAIVGAGARCTRCGGQYHHRCANAFGGCSSPWCADAQRVSGGLVATQQAFNPFAGDWAWPTPAAFEPRPPG
jgi:hypothetical protein